MADQRMRGLERAALLGGIQERAAWLRGRLAQREADYARWGPNPYPLARWCHHGPSGAIVWGWWVWHAWGGVFRCDCKVQTAPLVLDSGSGAGCPRRSIRLAALQPPRKKVTRDR